MTINGKPIVIFFCFQMCGAFVSYLGGRLGARIFLRLYEDGRAVPGITEWCVKAGLWFLLVPLVWAGLVLFRANRDAPAWELYLWFAFAVVFSLVVGARGFLAAIDPMLYMSCHQF